jgi:predicted ABC-type ATPase
MLMEIEQHFAARENFAFETTLAGRVYLQSIARWQAAGYHVKLIFLQLDSVEQAIARVAQRVKQGGHHVPENIIRRRFEAGRKNFDELYAPRVDAWVRHDNAGDEPRVIDWSERP